MILIRRTKQPESKFYFTTSASVLSIVINNFPVFRMFHAVLLNIALQSQLCLVPGDAGQFDMLGLLESAHRIRRMVAVGACDMDFIQQSDFAQHLLQGRSVVMTLEGVPTDLARRLLDFLSGIAYALQGKITPISAKTYFVTPQNVDVLGASDLAAAEQNDLEE